MKDKILVIDKLSKCFVKDKWILNNLSNSFHIDEIISIQGENGTGKTTLLRILATLTYPTAGKILLNDTHISVIEKKYRFKIGWMPSGNIGFYSKLTGLENIYFFSAFYKIDRDKLINEIDKWKENSVFKEALTTRFYLSSTGMKNILLLFKAYMHSPTLILLDEPLASFDQETAAFAISKIQEKAKGNLTIFTSHQKLDEVKLATRSLKLIGGRLV